MVQVVDELFYLKRSMNIFCTIIKATITMMILDSLFTKINSLPFLSKEPTDFPANAKKMNHIHETEIHVNVKANFS